MNIVLFFLPLAVVAAPPAGPDTLVVCPAEFRPALAEWAAYRRGQGHELAVVEPPASAQQLHAMVRHVAQSGRLKYVVLIGDEVVRGRETRAKHGITVPTHYVLAKVNVRWGSDSQIASDTPFTDVDGDNVPDVAIGRIPAHSAAELAAVVRKILRYEQLADHGPWEKCLSIVSGTGGFGVIADAVVEAAGRQVIQQTVPAEYDVRHLFAAANADGASQQDFCARARRQLNDGCLAWVYVGHGLPTELVCARTATGKQSILSTNDVPQLRCGPHHPLAVLIACYTGAMDAPQPCLGEELLLAEQGPVAVIAATRISMPYGNTVMGYELLRACFQDQPAALGEILRLAQRRVLKPTPNDQLRATLDGMAGMVSPPPVDLATERREHVLMYHLIGDPLLRLHRPAPELAKSGTATQLK